MKKRVNKTDKNDKNLTQLIELLSSGNEFSISGLQDALSIKSRTSIYALLQNLEDMNFPLVKIKKGKTCYFRLDQNAESDRHLYHPITRRTIVNQAVIDYVQTGKSRKQVIEAMTGDRSFAYAFGSLLFPLEQKQTNAYGIVNDLIAQGELELNNAVLSPTGNTIPLYLESEEDELYHYADQLMALPVNTPFSRELASIRAKVQILLDEQDYGAEPDIFLTYGRDYTDHPDLRTRLSVLSDTNYREYAICVTYMTNRNETLTRTVNVINIVYVTANDTLYLLAKPVDGTEQFINIRLHSIQTITTTDIKNNDFANPAYDSMFQEMLALDTNEPYEVSLTFRKVFNLYENLSQICQQRKATAKLSEEVDSEGKPVIRYTDTIRGINDFAKAFRRFSNLCIDASPPELKEKLMYTANTSCSRYEELIGSNPVTEPDTNAL